MKKSAPEPKPAPELILLEQLLANENNPMDLADRVAHLQTLRRAREVSCELDRAIMERVMNLQAGIANARDMQRRLKESLDRLTATPWFPATFLETCATSEGLRATVLCGNSRRVVRLAPGVDPATLIAGDEVFLGNELNVIVLKSPNSSPRGGETAVYEGVTEDGRLILRQHDDELVMAYVAASLRGVNLTVGDLVRFDRVAWLAYERIKRSKNAQLFLEETPQVTFAEIGGLGPEIEKIQRALNLHLYHADVARLYGARRKASIMLVGPSGVGKTMIAQALANWLATISPAGQSRFMNIKPSQLHSKWYSESEANYREVFKIAREAGAKDARTPVVMFFDEVDSVGMARGQALGHVDDRVLTAFMTELNGLAERGNIVVVSATNRRCSLDPALIRPGRLGDMVLDIPRPKRNAARDIFAKHLRTHVPFARNGHGDDQTATREEILEAAVSRLYAPNGDNELATLQFRDGKKRAVRAPDLISGAMIASIVNTAVERASVRDVETHERGLRFEDVAAAIDAELDAAIRILTPANCRQHLTDLPQDMDVVSVQPTFRKSRNAARRA